MDTNFTNDVTVIEADWLNNVNKNTYSRANKAALVAETPVAGQKRFVESSDGGFFIAKTGAVAGTYSDDGGSYCGTTFIPTGGDGSTAWLRVDGGYNVGLPYDSVWFGVEESSADNTPELQIVVDHVSSIGGGQVRVNGGIYDLDVSASSIALELKSNVTIKGAGRGVTILKNVGNCHVINLPNVTNCGLVDLTIDGDKDDVGNTSNTHCLRSEGIDGLTLTNVEFKNAPYYGIGLQLGSTKRVTASNIYIHDTNADGLDIKDPNLDNYDITFDWVKASNCGIDTIAIGASQAAISLRGTGIFTNIFIDEIPADAAGFRADQSTPSIADTQGARRSILSGFNIKAGASMTTGIGVDIRADSCIVSDGYVNGCYYGVSVTDTDVSVSDVVAEECINTGFAALDDDAREPDNVSFNNCTAKWAVAGGSTRGFRIASSVGAVTGASITNSKVRNANVGIIVDANSDYLSIENTDLRGNTSEVSDSGTNTTFDNNKGYKTFGTYTSTTIDVSSAGTKSFTITHGMPFTPDINDVSLTFNKDDAATDLVINYMSITAVSSTTVTGTVRVGTAASTGGLAAYVSATINSKKG